MTRNSGLHNEAYKCFYGRSSAVRITKITRDNNNTDNSGNSGNCGMPQQLSYTTVAYVAHNQIWERSVVVLIYLQRDPFRALFL